MVVKQTDRVAYADAEELRRRAARLEKECAALRANLRTIQTRHDDGTPAADRPNGQGPAPENTETALPASEERFRDFAESSADWFWEMDADLRFTYISPNVERISGVAPEWHYGRTREDLLGEGYDRDAWAAHLKTLEARRPFRDFIYRGFGDGGELKWFRTSGKPIFDKGGKFLGYRGTGSDVTDFVETHERAEKSERLLRDALESIADGFMLYDADDRLVMWNSRYQEMSPGIADLLVPGAKFEDLVRATAERGYAPKEIGDVESWVKLRLSRRKRLGEPLEYRRSGGVWMRVEERPTADGGVVSIRRDITEQRRAEQALRDSEARVRLILNSVPAAIAYIDRDQRYRFLNRAYAELRNTEPEEILGRTAEELLGSAAYAASRPHIESVLSGQIAHFQSDVPDKSGTLRIRDISLVPEFDDDGAVKGYFALTLDVTEQKQTEAALRESEAQLRLIADNLPVQMTYMDSEERFVIVNRTCENWYNRPAKETIGKKVTEIFDAANYAILKPKIDAVLAGENVTFEERIDYPDGTARDVYGTYIPDIGPDGRVRGYFALIEDITNRLAIEAQLRQAQKMEALGQLTGGVAHDFNNLLAVIVGNLDFLTEEIEDEEQQVQVQAALRSALRGGELVQRLLAFARKQTLQPQLIDLNQLVSDMITLLQRTLGEAIRIKMVRSDSPAMAEIDHTQLETALLNLAVNARGAMPKGGQLTIETSCIQLGPQHERSLENLAPGPFVVISVTDTGSGIPAEMINHVFEPFFTTKEVGEGSGLGLSMVHGFVKQSGGYVTVESEEGRGTTVEMYFPAADPDESSLEQAGIDKHVRTGAGETILVVEDAFDLRELAVAMLTGLGYRVLTAEDGRTALDILAENSVVDLLFTDVVLPGGIDGIALAKTAREQMPALKVLFTSGYTEHRAKAGGNLLTKPYRKHQLARRIRRALNQDPS
jgi:PAS domain S-box-containing protein